MVEDMWAKKLHVSNEYYYCVFCIQSTIPYYVHINIILTEEENEKSKHTSSSYPFKKIKISKLLYFSLSLTALVATLYAISNVLCTLFSSSSFSPSSNIVFILYMKIVCRWRRRRHIVIAIAYFMMNIIVSSVWKWWISILFILFLRKKLYLQIFIFCNYGMFVHFLYM